MQRRRIRTVVPWLCISKHGGIASAGLEVAAPRRSDRCRTVTRRAVGGTPWDVPQDRVPSRRNQLANRLSIELVARCASKSVVSKGNYRRFTCCGKVDSTQMRRRTERVERSSWRNSLLSAGRSLATTRRHGPSAASAPDHHPTWPQQYCPANECRQAQFAHPSTRGWPRAGRRSVWPGSLRVSESASVAR